MSWKISMDRCAPVFLSRLAAAGLCLSTVLLPACSRNALPDSPTGNRPAPAASARSDREQRRACRPARIGDAGPVVRAGFLFEAPPVPDATMPARLGSGQSGTKKNAPPIVRLVPERGADPSDDGPPQTLPLRRLPDVTSVPDNAVDTPHDAQVLEPNPPIKAPSFRRPCRQPAAQQHAGESKSDATKTNEAEKRPSDPVDPRKDEEAASVSQAAGAECQDAEATACVETSTHKRVTANDDPAKPSSHTQDARHNEDERVAVSELEFPALNQPATLENLTEEGPAPSREVAPREFSEELSPDRPMRRLPPLASPPPSASSSSFPLPPPQSPAPAAWQPATPPVCFSLPEDHRQRPGGPVSWQVIQQQVAALSRQAEDLLSRGACFAARAKMVEALRAISQALDVEAGHRQHSQALARAMQALREADDFAPSGSRLEGNLDLQRVVCAHRTPVLADQKLDHVSSLVAQRRYLEYAQREFAAAGANRPCASQALYGLARVYTLLGQTPADSPVRLARPKALCLHQAALLVDPQNVRAANELGVLLARCGQFEASRRVLQHAVSTGAEPATWHNLTVIHRELGETELARQAQREWEAAAGQQGGNSQPTVDPVRWVDPKAFSAPATDFKQ